MPLGKHVLGTVNEKRIYGTAKVGEKGQIVIPKEAREAFGINTGDTMMIFGDVTCGIFITKAELFEKTANEIIERLK